MRNHKQNINSAVKKIEVNDQQITLEQNMCYIINQKQLQTKI